VVVLGAGVIEPGLELLEGGLNDALVDYASLAGTSWEEGTVPAGVKGL